MGLAGGKTNLSQFGPRQNYIWVLPEGKVNCQSFAGGKTILLFWPKAKTMLRFWPKAKIMLKLCEGQNYTHFFFEYCYTHDFFFFCHKAPLFARPLSLNHMGISGCLRFFQAAFRSLLSFSSLSVLSTWHLWVPSKARRWSNQEHKSNLWPWKNIKPDCQRGLQHGRV